MQPIQYHWVVQLVAPTALWVEPPVRPERYSKTFWLGVVNANSAAATRKSASSSQASFNRRMRAISHSSAGRSVAGTTCDRTIKWTNAVNRGAMNASHTKSSGMATSRRTCAQIAPIEKSTWPKPFGGMEEWSDGIMKGSSPPTIQSFQCSKIPSFPSLLESVKFRGQNTIG
jgi:hypothetical protein